MKDILCEIVSPIAQIIIASVAIGNPIVTKICKRREEKRIAYNLLHGLYVTLDQVSKKPQKENIYQSAITDWQYNKKELIKVIDKNLYRKLNAILGFKSEVVVDNHGKKEKKELTWELKLITNIELENKTGKEVLSDVMKSFEKIYKLKRM